jgi:hypothetical protein
MMEDLGLDISNLAEHMTIEEIYEAKKALEEVEDEDVTIIEDVSEERFEILKGAIAEDQWNFFESTKDYNKFMKLAKTAKNSNGEPCEITMHVIYHKELKQLTITSFLSHKGNDYQAAKPFDEEIISQGWQFAFSIHSHPYDSKFESAANRHSFGEYSSGADGNFASKYNIRVFHVNFRPKPGRGFGVYYVNPGGEYNNDAALIGATKFYKYFKRP